MLGHFFHPALTFIPKLTSTDKDTQNFFFIIWHSTSAWHWQSLFLFLICFYLHYWEHILYVICYSRIVHLCMGMSRSLSILSHVFSIYHFLLQCIFQCCACPMTVSYPSRCRTLRKILGRCPTLKPPFMGPNSMNCAVRKLCVYDSQS